MPNKPIILIEGPDCAGKSYLAHSLIENNKAAYIHVNNYNDKTMTMSQHCPMVSFGTDWAKTLGLSPVVLDRHWLTLLVYTYVFDSFTDKENVDTFIMYHLPDWIINIDNTILCLPKNRDAYLETFRRHLENGRKEMYDNMAVIYDAFESLWLGKPCKGFDSSAAARFIWRFGGLQQLKGFYRYDYMQYQNRHDNFLDSTIRRGWK